MTLQIINKTNGTDKDYYLMIVDRHGVIHFANSYLVSNLGLTQAPFPKFNFFQLLDPGHLTKFRDVLSKVHMTDQPGEIEISARNGSLHWIKWEISNYKAEAGVNNKFFCVGYDIAGKRKVRKLYRVAKRNYEAIMEGLTIGVIMQDNMGEVLAVNKRAAEIFETSIENIYDIVEYKNLWKAVTDEKGPVDFTNSPPMIAVQSGAVQQNIQVNFQTHSGKNKTLMVNSQPLFGNDSQSTVSVVTSIIDITREKDLEKIVHQQEILFETFQNNTPHLSWMVDENAQLLYANSSFFKYLNLDENAIGKNILDLVPNVIGETLEKSHRMVEKTGQPQRMQEKMYLADGSMIVFWINLFPVQSVSGKKITGGEAINITERFKVEESLRHVNDRLKYLSHVTTDAIWEWNIKTKQIIHNQVLKDIIGVNTNNSQNLTWWFRRVHPDDRRRLHDTIKEVIENKKQTWESEYRFKKLAGDYMKVLDRGFVLYENGLPVRMIGSLHDVTQLKELEATLLQEKIHYQKNITETIFMVQEKERTRIGHELHDNVNQILSVCKLFAEKMNVATSEDDQIKNKVTTYIQIAIEEIRRLSWEIVTPQLKEKGLIESVSKLVDDLKVANQMNVLFHHKIDTEALSNGKKLALFRIMQEQVKNILKYSHAKTLLINLTTKENCVTLVIEDDGIGFEANQTSRGIGLSNIYERTKFYDGEVEIKTAPGQGCRLIVKIPYDL